MKAKPQLQELLGSGATHSRPDALSSLTTLVADAGAREILDAGGEGNKSIVPNEGEVVAALSRHEFVVHARPPREMPVLRGWVNGTLHSHFWSTL